MGLWEDLEEAYKSEILGYEFDPDRLQTTAPAGFSKNKDRPERIFSRSRPLPGYDEKGFFIYVLGPNAGRNPHDDYLDEQPWVKKYIDAGLQGLFSFDSETFRPTPKNLKKVKKAEQTISQAETFVKEVKKRVEKFKNQTTKQAKKLLKALGFQSRKARRFFRVMRAKNSKLSKDERRLKRNVKLGVVTALVAAVRFLL